MYCFITLRDLLVLLRLMMIASPGISVGQRNERDEHRGEWEQPTACFMKPSFPEAFLALR